MIFFFCHRKIKKKMKCFFFPFSFFKKRYTMSQASTCDDEVITYAHENAAAALLLRMRQRLEMLEMNQPSRPTPETQMIVPSYRPQQVPPVPLPPPPPPAMGLDDDFAKYFAVRRPTSKRDMEGDFVATQQTSDHFP